jgi:hypothetical protein
MILLEAERQGLIQITPEGIIYQNQPVIEYESHQQNMAVNQGQPQPDGNNNMEANNSQL